MTPSLLETASTNSFMAGEQEQTKYNRATPSADNKMQFAYQNMWPSETVKMDFEANNLERVTKIDQTQPSPNQATQQQQQQQQMHGQANTYNNIGNILSNLELLGNNTNFESGNFDIIPSTFDQQQAHIDPQKANHGQLSATVNGEAGNLPYYNMSQASQQTAAQQVYNNRHITDISNTLGPEQVQRPNAVVSGGTANNWMHSNQSVNDYKVTDNSLMELNNASGNVLLPPMTNYLYHSTPGASMQEDGTMSINSNHNDHHNDSNNNINT